MKLVSNLRTRPDFLYVAPALNVLALLLLPALLSSQLVVKSGVRIEAPRTASILQPRQSDHEIAITGGTEPSVYLDGVNIAPGELRLRLEELKAGSGTLIDINPDQSAPHGFVEAARAAAHALGCDVQLLGRPLE